MSTVRRALGPREARVPREEGSALVLALLFLTVSAVVIGALLSFVTTGSSATIAVRSARGTEYDAQSVMEAAIATYRVDTSGNCLLSGYSPSWTLNNAARPLKVFCFPQPSAPSQRHVVFSVCATSTACADSASLLRVDMIFYDDQGYGRAVGVQTWSNQ